MTDMQAALGLRQLDALDDILAERRRQAEHYNAALGGLPHFGVPTDRPMPSAPGSPTRCACCPARRSTAPS